MPSVTKRFFSRTGAALVAAIAAIASYSHMRHVALENGQGPMVSTLLPLSVDGLVVVGAMALADGRSSKVAAIIAFNVGVAASIAANVLAAPPTIVARVVSAWPALALLIVVEVIGRKPNFPVETIDKPFLQKVETGQVGAGDPENTNGGHSDPVTEKIIEARGRLENPTVTAIAAETGLSRPTVRRRLKVEKVEN